MKKTLFIILGCLLALYLCYFAFVYYVPYSEGTRAGELIKFSNRGVMIKTWEGEISQGISGAQIFSFSVLDKNEDVIEKMKEYQGSYVKVTYVERYTTFAFWGDTKYFITDVVKENSPHFNRN
ncbi:6-phosphogluconate dehydrogenase [Aequorivita echinoideorum]|uniref:6-phosphogluconate dehydrogenase n=1 Tax=Aequorivita echinoideorum TaxID=1549647 RepID=A0ABS5S4J0_9FLAO|nr:6-phosphogluconate dehydrogenase [Aequorivita echinoideorum]MBT0608137.1 6-phosphogluconate dehydrogenase [Aequorivita echinoideorum]